MRLIGLSLIRNEQWIVEFSLRVALTWVDELVVMLDRCTDNTLDIVHKVAKEHSGRVHFVECPPDQHWQEIQLRDKSLQIGRELGGTHFAIIDADEALTANLAPKVRDWFFTLKPSQLLELPMLAVRNLNEYQEDNTVWSRAMLTLGFCDFHLLTWHVASDGYQFHHRAPYCSGSGVRPLTNNRHDGGVFHLQWANPKRIQAKHLWYFLNERIRWPDRAESSVQRLNEKYSQATSEQGVFLRPIPKDWKGSQPWGLIKTDGEPYFDAEIRSMIERHGKGIVAGCTLPGIERFK